MQQLLTSPGIVAFNFIILSGLLMLLFREEVRFRRFRKRVDKKKAMLTAVSDELLSPLATIRKYIASMREGEFGEPSISQMEALGHVESATGQAFAGLGKLLASSRIEERDLSPIRQRVDIGECLHSVVNAVMAEAPKRKKGVFYELPQRKLSVMADPTLLHGIFDELLSNALHYTPKSGKIIVRIGKEKSDIRVTIQDQGIGISKDELPQIFESFFRGSNAREMYEGQGLGLSFVKKFLEHCNGSIEFFSALNQGTTCTVTLPKA